jgi:hypothetical protein
MRRRHHFFFVLAAVLCAGLPAQEKDPTANPPKSAPLRLHVIGASVSAGFRDGPMFGAEEAGDSVTLQYLLRQWCGEHARATTHPALEMMGMFQQPAEIGERQIAAALKAQPDVVAAIDFPFWFAYGYVQGDEQKARLELQAVGLKQLERLEMPVLIGDLPDMTGAAVRMLRPQQIPGPELLAELNERLRAFAAAHENVRLVPLAERLQQMKHDGVDLPLADGVVRTAPGALQQADRLHVTRLGMAFLAWSMQDELRQAFPASHPLREQRWTFEQFVEAAGAGPEVEAARRAAKAKTTGKPDAQPAPVGR